MTRKKLYYPKSGTSNASYTSGQELMFQNGEEYIGLFHEYDNGIIYSGPVFDSSTSKELFPYIPDEFKDNLNYNRIKSVKTEDYVSPRDYFPRLAAADYNVGTFNRYVVMSRNNNEVPMIEIDEDQYNGYLESEKGIDENVWKAVIVPWKITGPEYDVMSNGTLKEPGVVDSNARTIAFLEPTLQGISYFLSDLREFSVYSINTSREFRSI